jgi:hypothetical protein
LPQRLTGGLALGWQDVVLPQQRFFNLAFVRGWTSIAELFVVTFYFYIFIQQRFRGWTFLMSSPTPSPDVRRNLVLTKVASFGFKFLLNKFIAVFSLGTCF